MLKIKPIQDKDVQKSLCDDCLCHYRPDAFAYQAYEGEELLGVAQFEILGESSEIYNITQIPTVPDDFEGMFILGRAVLNFLDLCSVKVAKWPEPVNEKEASLARALGFKEVDGVPTLSLVGLFDAKCGGDGCH